MTVIIGITHKNKVYMGADRGASESGFLGSMINQKIAKVGPLLIGGSGSLGTVQLIQSLDYKEPDYNNLEKWIRLEFCKTIQEASEVYKVDLQHEDKGSSGFLLGIGSRLFEVNTEDYSAYEYDEIATGSGFKYALGSMYSTRDWDSPRARIREALNATFKYSNECAPPGDILTT